MASVIVRWTKRLLTAIVVLAVVAGGFALVARYWLAPAFVREFVEWGVGPRGGQLLILGAKALAAVAGRPAVSAADVRRAAVPALRHRVATNFQAQAEGIDSVAIVRRLLESIPEPKVPKYG